MSANTTASQRQVSTTGKLITTLVLLIVAGIGCVPLYWGVLAVQEATASLAWPQVDGQVTRSEVVATTTTTHDRNKPVNHRDRKSISYSAAIEYAFAVNGMTYHGSRLAVITEQFGSRDFAQATVEKYPRDSPVTVAYNPSQPDQCVLEPGNWGGTGFLFALATAFIGFPLLLIKSIWSSSRVDATDPQWQTKEQRRRFGLVFRERFIHWEPGKLIHVRRDPLELLQVIWSGLLLGFLLGAVLGLPPLLWFCSRQGPVYIGNLYLNISFALAIPLALILAYVYRRSETLIDWSQQHIHVQTGWFGRDVQWSDVQQVAARVPQPDKKPDTSSTNRKQYTGRIELQLAGRTHVMLATEYDRLAFQVVRGKLSNVAEELATKLSVPHQLISPAKII